MNSRLSRRQFQSVFAATVASATSQIAVHAQSPDASSQSPNQSIGLGFIACGGRAGELMGRFDSVDGTHVAAICDPDAERVSLAGKRFPKAAQYHDLRQVIDDEGVDAVVIAACNHWHCLAAIWAMQAGKDVYVEKPLSHSQWEGTQVVAAARKYDRICQMGTQQRSDPMQDEIKAFLHDEAALGKIVAVRVNRFGVRAPIGKRDTPLPIPKDVAYDLWLGPAADEPIFREKLHYDWHWNWNTGSGEMGNWGVHVLDDVRNNVFRDSVVLPQRIFGGGARIGLDDAGETPNLHLVQFDTGGIPVTIALNNLPAAPDSKKPAPHPGPGSGYLVYCEGGQYHGQRGSGEAFDNDGKSIRKFKGDNGLAHQRNFVDAVVAHDRSMLNTEVELGNATTGWCNLANIAFRVGGEFNSEVAKASDSDIFLMAAAEAEAMLAKHGESLDGGKFQGSDWLSIDASSGHFTGSGSEVANGYLRREYRKGYEVPEIVSL